MFNIKHMILTIIISIMITTGYVLIALKFFGMISISLLLTLTPFAIVIIILTILLLQLIFDFCK
jgi:hypothetical protein